MNIAEIRESLNRVQEKIGFEVPTDIALAVYDYTGRKCKCNGKGESYIPILFETELVDYFTRLAINMDGGLAHV